MLNKEHSNLTSASDLEHVREGWDFEAKKAAGADGQGKLPEDFWKTYSAMANTTGGRVVLGVREREDGGLELHGLGDPQRVERELWTLLHDRDKVSANLLTKDCVHQRVLDGKVILIIDIPQAPRDKRPVFLKRDPFTNTYIRTLDGDRLAEPQRVRRMFADADPGEPDSRVVEGFGMEDLHEETISRYRNLLSARRPGHPFLLDEGIPFLRQIRAWGRDRERNTEGPTLAGLLVFGREQSILDRLPRFHLDYRELPDVGVPGRWRDRVYPDGTWNANILEFYLRVQAKLHDQLPLPFSLAPNLLRRDETPVHEALREALVNSLIHADYTTGHGIRILRTPGSFTFINPGTLLLSLPQIRQGGTSACRNRTVQHLLTLIGVGERAGSGVPAILAAWRQQHWRTPILREDSEREETTLSLAMASLLPAEVVSALRKRFGSHFEALDEAQRTVLALASAERVVDHGRLSDAIDLSSRELTVLLQGMLRRKFLERVGHGRGCAYRLPNPVLPIEDAKAGEAHSEHYLASSEQYPDSSELFSVNSEHSKRGSEHSPESSELSTANSELSDVSALKALPSVCAVRDSGRASAKLVAKAILDACHGRYLTLPMLAEILDRRPDTLRTHYLRQLLDDRRLEMRHPSAPNHPSQAYRTSDDIN